MNLYDNFVDYRYLVRPSPFSAQKTFERHNSRRKSNISFCSNLNLGGLGGPGGPGSRRGSGFTLNNLQGVPNMSGYGTPRGPLVTTKSNSLSLPDSPTVAGQTRGRSNSLRVRIYTIQQSSSQYHLCRLFNNNSCTICINTTNLLILSLSITLTDF